MSNEQENFSITENVRNINPDFGLEQILYSISFRDIPRTFEQASNELNQMFDHISKEFTRSMNSKDKIRIAFFHNQLFTCIDLPFVLKKDFTAQLLITSFESVVQSYKDIIVNTNNDFSANV